MSQIEQYIGGERDYTKIKGSTGPLVYPAIHVYIYRFLHDITRGGNSIVLAQVWFAALYVFNLGVVMACYMKAQVCFLLNPLACQDMCTLLATCSWAYMIRTITKALLVDTTLPPPYAHPLEASSQYLCTSLLQRLLGHWFPLPRNLLLPTQRLDYRRHSFFSRSWRQNESPPRVTSNRCHTLSSERTHGRSYQPFLDSASSGKS